MGENYKSFKGEDHFHFSILLLKPGWFNFFETVDHFSINLLYRGVRATKKLHVQDLMPDTGKIKRKTELL